MSDELLTVMQARERARVSRRTIYNWLEAGKLQTVRLPSGRVLIRASSLFLTDTKYPQAPDAAAVTQ